MLLSFRLPRSPRAVRRALVGAACVIGLVLLADRSPVAVTAFRRAEPPVDAPADFTLLSYNVNYGVADRPEPIEAIAEIDADVVVLQETTDELEARARDELGERYPHQLWRSPDGRWLAGGAAILARWPLADRGVSPSPVGWFEALAATVETPGGPVRVIGVHLESAQSPMALLLVSGHHRREIEAHLEALAPGRMPVVVAGDFNEERAGALRELESRGYEDAVARFEGAAPTWTSSGGVVVDELQLDHVLHGEGLEALDAEVLELGISDHRPVRVRFRVTP